MNLANTGANTGAGAGPGRRTSFSKPSGLDVELGAASSFAIPKKKPSQVKISPQGRYDDTPLLATLLHILLP